MLSFCRNREVKALLALVQFEMKMFKYFPKRGLRSSCLHTIRKLQKYGHLPGSPILFQSYAGYGQFIDVRCAAVDALVDYTRGCMDFLEFHTYEMVLLSTVM